MLLLKKKNNLESIKKDFAKNSKKFKKNMNCKISDIKSNMNDFVENVEKNPQVKQIACTAKEKPVPTAMAVLGFGMTVLGITALLLKK